MKKLKLLRKTHRYLGLILGIQFLMWTISGLYFSWTDLDDIHGDGFKNLEQQANFHQDLIALSALDIAKGIQKIELREINQEPYYWINNEKLFHVKTGVVKKGITEKEAIAIAQIHMQASLKVKQVDLLKEIGKHHEYRNKPLPVYVITFEGSDKVKAYVSQKDGRFVTIRHERWRWFDFLWMLHTMNYEGRDNFNTFLLRFFSFFGLITILSGFVLWFISSPTLRKLKRKMK